MGQPLIAVGKYNAIENSVFFEDGTTHQFRGELLSLLSVKERYEEIQRWAKFKGVINTDEEIVVPGFAHETKESSYA